MSDTVGNREARNGDSSIAHGLECERVVNAITGNCESSRTWPRNGEAFGDVRKIAGEGDRPANARSKVDRVSSCCRVGTDDRLA
ncbi:unannotated protein [freshwater metagenome]|uniref:Unannotated protein n=1 Tax=freshwater metagenome TaxID=449393 RepID=A0A6J6XED9_9ZZZZ